MAMNSLAKPTFMAGPEEALIAADAYGAGEVVTVDSDTTNYGLSETNSPVGIKIKPPPIPGLENLNPFKAGVGLKLPDTLPQSEILDRVMDSNISIKNCFTNMSDAAKNLLKIPGELLGKLEATINGVVNKIKNFDPSDSFKKLGDLKAIGCSANALTNGKFDLTISDKGGLSGLISGITTQASSLGINNVFSSIASVVKDKDVLLSAVKNILPNAVKDINLLKDLSSTSIVNNIKSIMPNISGNTINNFRIESGTKNYDLPNVFSNIKTTLDNIDDSWNRVSRSGEILLAGNLFTSSSALDFHKTLESSVMYNPLTFDYSMDGIISKLPSYDEPEMFYMLTKNLGEQDVAQCLSKDFNELPITVNGSITNSNLSDKNEYSLNSSDTTYEQNNDTVIQIVKVDSDTKRISVIDSEIKNNNESLPNKLAVPPEYPEEGTYLGTSEKVYDGTRVTKYTRQGPMKGSSPSYDQDVTTVNITTNEIISIKSINVPYID